MQRILSSILTLWLICLTANLVAQAPEGQIPQIEGTYSAKGTNPGGSRPYQGNVIISKTKETYKVVWSVGPVYIGTGIVTGDVLAVAYLDENKKSVGIVAYKILEGGKKLEGIWTPYKGQVLGKETLEKK